jgi:hypothetical protein
MKSRSVCHEIEHWARHRNGERFCETCIAREIGQTEDETFRRAIVELCAIGRGSDFSRYRGTCSLCGDLRSVIAPNRLVWA